MTDELDPQRTLQNFFLLDRALAFHDQTRPSGCYTYGSYTPQVVQETPAGKISSLHLLTSPGGGLATFIAPKLPVDRTAIEDYIRRHFVPAPETITLEQEELQQSLWLHFAQRPATAAYSVEFEQSKMALTHEESGRLAGAIQGTKDQVYFLTRSRFSVDSRVNARLQADWVEFVTLAFNEQARQPEAIARLLNQQIDAGVVIVQAQFDNAPSEQTQARVRQALVNTASLLIANTLRNISSPEQIPNKLNYQIEYDDTVPQRYLLEQQHDIAELLNRLPADGIISFTATPLPEPSRPDKPIEPQRCTVSLGFDPKGFNIMAIELRWADQQMPMTWPSFPPVTLETTATVSDIALKVTFADYTSFENRLAWQNAIALTPQDVGFYSLLFDAESLKSEFKTISGSASYLPAGQGKKQSFTFAFSAAQWQATWWINAHAAGLNGRVDYRWQGKTAALFPKNYDSGPLQATTGPIKLQYHK